MIEPPELVDAPAQTIAFIPIVVPRERIREVMEPGIKALVAAIAAQGQEPAGPLCTRHVRIDPSVFDFEICFPVARPIRASGRVRPGSIAAARVARTVYHGPYEGLGEAWAEFRRWLADAGLSLRGEILERYLTGPESTPDPARWRTELNHALAEPAQGHITR